MPNFYDRHITAVKAISDSSDVIKGILVPFGSKVQRDMHGEFFTPTTDIKEDWYKERPLLYGHGRAYFDGSPGAKAVGTIIELTKSELGWWAKAQLDRATSYFDYIKHLIEEGAMYFSSGAIPGMVEVTKEGEVLQWPLVEGSLTPTPADPRRTNVSMVKSIFTDMGLEFNDSLYLVGQDNEGEGDMPKEKEKEAAKDEKDEKNEAKEKEVEENPRKSLDLDLNLNVNLLNGQEPALKESDNDDGDEEEDDEEKKPNSSDKKEVDVDEEPKDKKEEEKKTEKEAKETEKKPEKESEKEEGDPNAGSKEDEKEMECYVFDNYDGTEEVYCFSADSYNQETKERTMVMNEQFKQFIINGAKHSGFTVNDEGAKSVAEKMREYYKSLTGNENFTMTELKLMMGNPEFVEKSKEWFKSFSENGDVDELAKMFAPKETKSKENTDSENKEEVGKNGKSKSAPADSPAANTPNHLRNFKERHKLDNLDTPEKSFYAHKMNELYMAKYKRAWPGYDGFLESLEDESKDFMAKYHMHMHMGDEQSELRRTPGDVPLAIKAMERIGDLKSSHSGVKALGRGPTQSPSDFSGGNQTTINFSTFEGFGDDWVADLWKSQLWGLAQSEAVVLGLIGITPMPSNPYNMPLEGDDPEIYGIPETNIEEQFTNTGPVPASKIPTHNTQIYAHKLGIRSALSHEYEEDAIIDVIPNMLRKQRRAFYNGIDHVVLNALAGVGDATNISHFGQTPIPEHKVLMGIEKGIVTQTLFDTNPLTGDSYNPANGSGMGHVLDAMNGLPKLEMWRAAQGMLHELYMTMESDLVWIVTPKTRHVIQSTDKFLDAEVNSGKITGKFGDVTGIPIVTSHQMLDRDEYGRIVMSSPGVVDKAKSNRGIALLLYRPYWTLGYRRRFETWSLYDPVYDAYQAGAWMRLGMIRRDGQSGNGDQQANKPLRTTSVIIRNLRV